MHITGQGAARYLIENGTAVAASAAFQVSELYRTFQARGETSSGAGAATILVQGSIDGVNWILLGTISLTLGTVTTSDGLATSAMWPFVRGNITAISGTDASVDLLMGV